MMTPDRPEVFLINLAISKGIKQLLEKSQEGSWKGFPTLAGDSDVWVTGFILTHIQSVNSYYADMDLAQRFLKTSRKANNGWSYSEMVPSDADSTAWCLLALSQSAHISENELEESKVFLWNHFFNSGVATYSKDSGIGQFIGAPNNEAIIGWTSPHPDVSVAAILADPLHNNVPTIFSWLNTLQDSNGFIESYWWRSPLYTTTLFLRAMQQAKVTIDKQYAQKLLSGLSEMQLENGGFAIPKETQTDSFSTALALEIFVRLSNYCNHGKMTGCVQALLDNQKADGGWEGNFILRIPAPYILNPNDVIAYDNPDGGGNSFIKDQDGLFATTMSCFALELYRTMILEKATNTTQL